MSLTIAVPQRQQQVHPNDNKKIEQKWQQNGTKRKELKQNVFLLVNYEEKYRVVHKINQNLETCYFASRLSEEWKRRRKASSIGLKRPPKIRAIGCVSGVTDIWKTLSRNCIGIIIVWEKNKTHKRIPKVDYPTTQWLPYDARRTSSVPGPSILSLPAICDQTE